MIDDDNTFRALSDSNRRKILDILVNSPGINVNELSGNFHLSRFAVMKHLKVLEEAKLVVSRREGKEKKLFVNLSPIHQIYRRWSNQYAEYWDRSITNLKSLSEGSKKREKLKG